MSIIWRDKDGPNVYEQARIGRLFNLVTPKRYPLAIIDAGTEEEIVSAMKLATQRNCRVSVRSGGHSFASWSLQDDALLVDLGSYAEIELDARTGIVCVSPSVTGEKLIEYLSQKGRAFPVGHCPSVGVGGFLLAGGMGWNSSSWGWSCEFIIAVDVVTASGELVRADCHNNIDLFWAARGGGPAFPGIVTRFHLQTRPNPCVMRSSGYVYPVSSYKVALNWAITNALRRYSNIEISVLGLFNPQLDSHCIMVSFTAFSDNETIVKQALQSIQDSHPLGELLHWFGQKTDFTREFQNMAKAYPENHRYTVDNAFLKDGVDVATILEPAFTALPNKKTLALWTSMIPCSSRRELSDDMALSVYSDHYFALYTIWEDEADDSLFQSWSHQVMDGVAKYSVGSYVGEFDFEARPFRVWGDDQKRRLLEVRRKWDPDNRICVPEGIDI